MERPMELLTKVIQQRLPRLYSTDGQGDQAVAQVKFFTPDANWTWYPTEYDPNQRLFFGLAVGPAAELGYISQEELEGLRGPLGLPVERDLHFEPTPIAEIKKQLREQGYAV